MKVQQALRLAHISSVLISFLANALLVLVLLSLLTLPENDIWDGTEARWIDPSSDARPVDPPLPEIKPEDINNSSGWTCTGWPMDPPPDSGFRPEPPPGVTEDQVDAMKGTQLVIENPGPLVMPGTRAGRDLPARKAAIAQYAQGEESLSEPAVLRALEWLRDHQHVSGGWTENGDLSGAGVNAGYTGLALLTFLAHGDTPESAQFGPTVARGLRFLVENQAADGLFQPAGRHTAYGHAIATYAVAEAYTMTDHILLREPLRRAVEVLIQGQQSDGGYDYEYKKAGRKDLSLAAWQMQALKAASLSDIDDNGRVRESLQRAMDGMLTGSNLQTRGRSFAYALHDGNFAQESRRIVTAAAALGLQLSGRERSREARETLQWLAQFTEAEYRPAWGRVPLTPEFGGEINFWYYAVQTYFHENPKGAHFRRFMPSMVRALVHHQASDGHWLCFTDGGARQGKTYNTTLAALGLMVYYRYLPSMQTDNLRPQNSKESAPSVEEGTEVEFQIAGPL